MEAYRIEKRVTRDGTITIEGLPFRAGEMVEVIVRGQKPLPSKGKDYPLRGKPVRYPEPFASVAQDEWEALR
jgi:hypothetical protein